MANKQGTKPASGPAMQMRPEVVMRKGHRIVRTLAQSTFLAAGLAVAQLGSPEIDSRFHVFDPNLVDRLRAPITRYHE
jgi:hypothetical protein